MECNVLTSTPGPTRFSIGGSSSNSVRRRSLITPVAISRGAKEVLNDDEAERLSLVTSERSLVTSTPHSPRSARDTITSSPQKEHFQGCLKLYAENKITKDNAWNLQLIDYMTSMLRRHDARMENLQTASTVIDASARIYAFRVDAVHYDVLKMAGGLVKATQSKRGKKDDQETQEVGAVGENGTAAPTKKKKKKSKGVIATNPDVLNGDFESIDSIDPFFEKLAATKGDVTASNRAFNVTIPIDEKTYELKLGMDELFLELIDEKESEEIDLSDQIVLPYKLIPPWTEDDEICAPFAGFSMTNWNPDTEDVDNRVNEWVDDNRLNLSQQALVFDVNAEVEPIPRDDAHNDLFDDEPLAGIESDEEADVAVAACVARVAAAPPVRLADMRPQCSADSRLEYSYNAAIVSAWAGPSHWRLKNNRASRQTDRVESAAGRQTIEGRKARTKRQLDFLVEGMAFDCRAEPSGDYTPTQPAKIMISRKTLATGYTWNEANYKTPIDRGLDESHFRKLFLRRRVLMLRKRDLEAAKEPEPPQLTVDDANDYDYNNENDASYCPNSAPDGDDWVNEDATAAGDLHEQVKNAEIEGLGDMLEPPTKVAKIFIPYATRAKKVDMKQLKHCSWKILTEKTPPGEKEDVAPTTFFSTYFSLPNRLTPNARESLSVPLALLSVLHLANEKGLVLQKRDDLQDFDILGLIKK